MSKYRERQEHLDSACKKIVAASNELATELGDCRRVLDEIATMWLRFRNAIPLGDASTPNVLAAVDIMRTNSALLHAQALGIISRDIDLRELKSSDNAVTLDDDIYIGGGDVRRIQEVATRLYSETRFKDGDEMRDNAQQLQAVLDHVQVVPRDGGFVEGEDTREAPRG